jgi:uncharacterized DUF497 family protein
VKCFDWNQKKNELSKLERGVCFEDVVLAINSGGLIIIIEHPNKKLFPNQQIYILEINKYAYLVPFVDDKDRRFLKTIIPSRKMTKKYLVKKGKK